MTDEVIEYLITDPSGVYVDGTCGLGGHAERIVEKLSQDGKLYLIDRDVEMLKRAEKRLRDHEDRVVTYHGSYDELGRIRGLSEGSLAGIFLDLGICSAQLDAPERGFSYRFESSLDMRFDRTIGVTAHEFINTASREELADVLRSYGDFSRPNKLVDRIVDRRQEGSLRTVGDLVSCVEDLFPRKTKNKHTARLLQSIRIAVNNELEKLDRALPVAVSYLRPGGRLVVISYHSQEDRRVKRFIRNSSKSSGLPPEIEVCMKGKSSDPVLQPVTKKAIKASADEIESNPRARSARLRVAERLSYS